MKFLATIRARYAKFFMFSLSKWGDKYAKLNAKHQRFVKSVATVVFAGFIYLLIHHGYLLIFAHKRLVPSPMVIRHGNRIEIPQDSPLRAQIEFKTIALSTEPHILHIPGWVEAIPSKNVNILPPLTGRLISLRVGIGDQVKFGQILATISSPDFAAANADYQKAMSAYALTKTILKRAQSVNQVGGNSIQMVQQAKNDALQAASELKRATARLKTLTQHMLMAEPKSKRNPNSAIKEKSIFYKAQITLENPRSGLISLRSPVSGRVTSLNYGLGSYINDLTTPLMRIVDLREVWVTANVAENMVSKIHKKQQVRVTFLAYPDNTYQGHVSFVHPELDPDTRRNQTRIVLLNPDEKLQPNMYANVEIRVKESPQIMIPLSSILMNNESTVVYVESSPWVCQRREIELGSEDGEFVRVLSGLKSGERIVTCGGVFINDK